MPKRTRKMKERAAMRRNVIAQDVSAQPEANAATSTLAPSTRATYATPTFDYSHIYRDLRRIAIFAVFFFAVLIALSYVIK